MGMVLHLWGIICMSVAFNRGPEKKGGGGIDREIKTLEGKRGGKEEEKKSERKLRETNGAGREGLCF